MILLIAKLQSTVSQEDVLYHLALGTGSHHLQVSLHTTHHCTPPTTAGSSGHDQGSPQAMFGDVRYVCMGGTPHRMKAFAEFMLEQVVFAVVCCS